MAKNTESGERPFVYINCLNAKGKDASCVECEINKSGYCKIFVEFIEYSLSRMNTFRPEERQDILAMFYDRASSQASNAIFYKALLRKIFQGTVSDFIKKHQQAVRPGVFYTGHHNPETMNGENKEIKTITVRFNNADSEHDGEDGESAIMDQNPSPPNAMDFDEDILSVWKKETTRQSGNVEPPGRVKKLLEILNQWLIGDESAPSGKCARLLLYYLEMQWKGYKDKEIAENIGIKPNTFTQRKKTCLNLLYSEMTSSPA